MIDGQLKLKINECFVKKPCDLNDNKIIASIITACMYMADYTDIVTSKECLEILKNLYDIKNNTVIQVLIGMPYYSVRNYIGYNIDFLNDKEANDEYSKNFNKYHTIYSEIGARVIEKNIDKDQSIL